MFIASVRLGLRFGRLATLAEELVYRSSCRSPRRKLSSRGRSVISNLCRWGLARTRVIAPRRVLRSSLLTRTRSCEWLVLERANVDHQARVVTTRRTVVEGVVKPTGKRSARHEASLCPQERRKRSTSTRHRSIPACSFRNAWRVSRRSHRGVTAASRTRRYGRPAPSTHGVRATAHVCEPFDRRGREPVRALPAHGALPAMLDNTYGHVLRRVGGWRRAPQRRRASPRRGRTRSLTRARVTLVAQANKNWLAQPCGCECRPPWARSLLRWPYSFRTESAKTSLHPSQRTSTEGPACSASAGEVSPLRCTSPVTTSRRGHARQPPRRTRARHAGERGQAALKQTD